MNPSARLDLWRASLIEVATVAAPFMIAALVVGLTAALIQTATQLQEASLSFVPKLAAALLVLALGGRIILDRLTHFAHEAIASAGDTHSADDPP